MLTIDFHGRLGSGRLPLPLAGSLLMCLLCAPAVRAQEAGTSAPAANPAPQAPRVAQVVVSGTRVIDARTAANAARGVIGQVGDADALRQAAQAVIELYRRRGYVMAQIVDAEVAPNGQLRLTVAEGTIRQILIRGNRRTRTRTVQTVLTVRPGEVFQESAIRADRARLARLGIFADVTITPRVPGSPDPIDTDDTTQPAAPAPAPTDPIGEGKTPAPPTVPTPTEEEPAPPTPPATPETAPAPPAEPAEPPVVPPSAVPPVVIPPADPLVDPEEVGVVDVIVRVRERPTANIAATVGYTDNVGAVGFVDVSEDNLLGTGHRTSIQWQRTATTNLRDDGTFESGDARSAFGFAYDVPALRRSDLSFGAEVYDKNTVFLPFFAGGRETLRSYERRRGGRVRVGRALFGSVSGFVTARRDQIGYDDLPDRLNPSDGDVNFSDGSVGALGFGLIADGRDQLGFPQSGYRHSLLIETARPGFGGTFNFTQATLDLRQYVPLAPSRLAANGKDRLPVPVFATRLYGGVSTGSVPLPEQFYLGGPELLRGYDLFSVYGETAVLGTAELRLPVGQGLQAVAFADVGSAWEPTASFSSRGLKAGIGAGLRFASPIGPIRLDAAYGNRFQTYVSLGQSF